MYFEVWPIRFRSLILSFQFLRQFRLVFVIEDAK